MASAAAPAPTSNEISISYDDVAEHLRDLRASVSKLRVAHLQYPALASLPLAFIWALTRGRPFGATYTRTLALTTAVAAGLVIEESFLGHIVERKAREYLPIAELEDLTKGHVSMIAACAGATSGAILGKQALRSVFTHSMTAIALSPAVVYAKREFVSRQAASEEMR